MGWHTECECYDYYAYIKTIDSGLDMLIIHGMDIVIKPFIYCPYCGKKLKKIDDETNKEIVDVRQLKLL
jgi:hypothetical protein